MNYRKKQSEPQSILLVHDTQELGKSIKASRKKLKLTQPQLALASGCGLRFIVELEAGKPSVRLEIVLRVIHALGAEFALTNLPEEK